MIASDSTPKKLKSVSPVNKPESPAYLKYPSVTLSPQSPGAVTNSVLQRSLKVVPRPKQGHKRCKGRPTSQERTLSLTSLWLKDLKRPAAPATGSLSLRCFGWTRQCPWFPRPQRLTTRCLRGSASLSSATNLTQVRGRLETASLRGLPWHHARARAQKKPGARNRAGDNSQQQRKLEASRGHSGLKGSCQIQRSGTQPTFPAHSRTLAKNSLGQQGATGSKRTMEKH